MNIDKEKLLAAATLTEIELPVAMRNASEELINKVCNGVGAEWMPSGIRSLLDARFSTFKIAVAVHDWAYNFSPYCRDAIDAKFYDNMKKCIAYVAPWYRPIKRWLLKKDALILFEAVKIFGGKAYAEAQEEGAKIDVNI